MKSKTELLADIDRVTDERDAALAEVDRLDNALNVTDAAATKWLSDLSSARQLFELILDDPRLVVAMSSDILISVKSLLAVKSEPFESKVSALQQRLTAADERADSAITFVTRLIECAGGQPSVATGYLHDILAALKPAEVPYAHSGEDDFGHRERDQ